jgi:CRP-like cAMP-binding protein
LDVKPSPPTNRLLSALPDKDRVRVLARCDRIELAAADVLYQAGARLRYVYFPIDSYVSLMTSLDSCAGLEVALVGNEGMVGVSLLLGVSTSPRNHLVQGAGSALRITAASFAGEIERSQALRRRLNRYAYVKTHQFAQTAACTHFHGIEKRLARWMLTARDRSHSNDFHATHEFLACALGVRRVGITKAASSLQHQLLISYRRGDITILDGRRLEDNACGCYMAGIELYDRILGRDVCAGDGLGSRLASQVR